MFKRLRVFHNDKNRTHLALFHVHPVECLTTLGWFKVHWSTVMKDNSYMYFGIKIIIKIHKVFLIRGEEIQRLWLFSDPHWNYSIKYVWIIYKVFKSWEWVLTKYLLAATFLKLFVHAFYFGVIIFIMNKDIESMSFG